jgi:A/G-specific adenine glycosylase
MSQDPSRKSDPFDARSCAAALLRWYDAQARVLPWRVPPGSDQRPDPYRVWLSEIMLQQTTVAAVKAYYHRFTTRWPDVQALAAAPDADVLGEWAGLGYYARARNLLACARIVAANGGFPDTAEGLRALPGVGPYTAAAIAAIAFGRAETVVDGNVERVVARLWAVRDPLPGAKKTLVALAGELTPRARAGDHAQAMMDLGATICIPRNPRCPECPVAGFCQGQAIAASLPAKAPKAAKPTRRGVVYIARRPDGAVLTETRPPKGLLGGMTGFPGTDWAETPAPAPPLSADWRLLPGEVRHTFTHFHLILSVAVATTDADPLRGAFDPALDPGTLPTVMRKCWEHAASARLAEGLPLG